MKNGDLKREGVLYFLTSDSQGAVKIGFAEDLYTRIKTLQTGNPDELTLVGRIPCVAEAEILLHRALLHKRIRLEWYPWDEDLQAFVFELLDDMVDAGMERMEDIAFDECQDASDALSQAYYSEPLPTELILERAREYCPKSMPA